MTGVSFRPINLGRWAVWLATALLLAVLPLLMLLLVPLLLSPVPAPKQRKLRLLPSVLALAAMRHQSTLHHPQRTPNPPPTHPQPSPLPPRQAAPPAQARPSPAASRFDLPSWTRPRRMHVWRQPT